MMKQLLFFLLIPMMLVVPLSGAAAGQDHDRAYKATRAAGLLPYSRIRKLAEKKTGGKIISQKLVRTNVDNWIYQLRIRKADGRVAFAVIDAKSGKILSVK